MRWKKSRGETRQYDRESQMAEWAHGTALLAGLQSDCHGRLVTDSAELTNQRKKLRLAHQVIDLIEKVGFVVGLSNKAAVIGDLAIARPDLSGRNYEQHARPPCVHLSR
jgi:hypothetical protein